MPTAVGSFPDNLTEQAIGFVFKAGSSCTSLIRLNMEDTLTGIPRYDQEPKDVLEATLTLGCLLPGRCVLPGVSVEGVTGPPTARLEDCVDSGHKASRQLPSAKT